MMKKVIKTDSAPAPIGPYNQAIMAGDTLYVSGQIAMDAATGNIVDSTIEAETHQVMANLKAVLNAGGLDFIDVVKTSIFLSDMNSFAKVNEVYGQYFTHDFPARETVAVKTLPKNVNVEISAIAVKG